ncbi:hypothetical protein BDN67DRAFT_985959 [Paxillus ammoniavirescens]|nr:hypothetical protein BDN67DRAFT_985959 [Paxillus ammoniavirescens]
MKIHLVVNISWVKPYKEHLPGQKNNKLELVLVTEDGENEFHSLGLDDESYWLFDSWDHGGDLVVDIPHSLNQLFLCLKSNLFIELAVVWSVVMSMPVGTALYSWLQEVVDQVYDKCCNIQMG